MSLYLLMINNSKDYEMPDEKLGYSQLKDRIREECKRALPVKERILLMAKKLEDDLILKDTICEQICADHGDVTSERHIQRCLPDQYKQRRRKKATEESTGQFATMSVVEGKNVPEQKVMAVDAKTGQEEEAHLEDKARPNVMQYSERVKILKKQLNESETERDFLKRERDDLINQVKVLKEKSTLELFRELQEKFHDQPGLLNAKELQKVRIEAGRNLMIQVRRYYTILQEAVERGQPLPVGTYIMTKPEMKLVPVRILVDFNRKRVWLELWEKKLQ